MNRHWRRKNKFITTLFAVCKARCERCGSTDYSRLILHHKIPRSQGGEFTPENLVKHYRQKGLKFSEAERKAIEDWKRFMSFPEIEARLEKEQDPS